MTLSLTDDQRLINTIRHAACGPGPSCAALPLLLQNLQSGGWRLFGGIDGGLRGRKNMETLEPELRLETPWCGPEPCIAGGVSQHG